MPSSRVLLILALSFVSMTQYVSCSSNSVRALATTQASRPPVASPGVTPPIEPLVVETIAPADAVAINKTLPFVASIGAAARPFVLSGEPGFDRAADCLTAAVYYEAASEGDAGERAVAQVVLNRVRHPAYPKSVCGVVFQGSERHTGCQFTFTCDGALARVPSVSGWARARGIAREALQGRVYGGVGHATHYHTDWVIPVWRTKLDKLVQLGSHIFYRWAGPWGSPGAFRGTYQGSEERIAALAPLSPAHAEQLAGDTAEGVPQTSEIGLAGEAQPIPGTPAAPIQLLAQLDKASPPDTYPALARTACSAAPRCTFLGWTDAAYKPGGTVVSPGQRDALSFSYVRDETAKVEKLQWNCREFRDRDIRTCMKTRLLVDIQRDEREVKR